VVTCLPLDPRFAGLCPAEDGGLLRTIKICRTTSFGGEVKQWVSCRKIYDMLKNLTSMKNTS
jgi:hypothetical protein